MPAETVSARLYDRPAAHDAVGRPRFGILLCLIAATYLVISAAPTATWSIVLAFSLIASTVLLAGLTARVSRFAERALAALAGGGLAVTIALMVAAEGTSFQPESRAITYLTAALFAGATPATIVLGVVRDLRARGVTVQAVYGAISVYLLIGIAFAVAYGALANLDSAALSTDGTDGDSQIRLYFSFVTLTSVGYGDFSPATDLSRTLATLQALLGQLYLVTVVAVLVGNLGRQALRRPG